jgi:DNA mismatch repair protein MutS
MPPKRTAAGTAKPNSMDELYEKYYKEYTAKYGPKTAILMQVGKFFEMYDSVNVESGVSRTNVSELAEVCGSAPEPKDTSDPVWKRVFWGFPEHSLQKFERLLIQANYTVVVVTQDRDATERVTGRTVNYVSSPGTYFDAEHGNAKGGEDRNIVGILIDSFENERGGRMWYIATSAFDVSTGQAVSMEDSVSIVDGRPVVDSLEPFWSLHAPVEVVCWTRNVPAVTSGIVQSWFTGFRGPLHLYALSKDAQTAAAARGRAEFLHRMYKPATTLSTAEFLGLERHPMAFQCLAHLLEFVQDHNPSYLEGIKDHRLWAPEDELLLGNSALEQLAMLPTGKPHECLLHWLQKAYTAVGKRTLRQRCLKPIADIEELDSRQDRIAELRTIQGGDIDRALKGVYDVTRISRKLQLGKGTAADLLQLLSSYDRVLELMELTKGTLSTPESFIEFQTYIKTLKTRWSSERIRACDTGHSLAVGPRHPWSSGIHADLDAMEEEWRQMYTRVQELKQSWDDLLGERDALKLENREETPFQFSTTKRRAASLATLLKQRQKVDLTIQTRGSSSVHVLETPELKQLNERAVPLMSRWTYRVLELWQLEWRSWNTMEDLQDWVGRLDAEYAFARIAEEYGYSRPAYVEKEDTSGLSIKDLRHPILERVHTATPYIPHSLELGCLVGHQKNNEDVATAEHGILLYGVNAAGKSSLSKAIGLAILLAQCGIPVPATEMTLAPYNALFTRILGNDNLWAGMSSFVVEMTEFRSILRSAGPKTLVLGDELCAGTETVSAIAIVTAGIQTLVNKRTQFVFATHLHELMDLPEVTGLPTVHPYHLTVHADLRAGGRLLYDRKLKKGSGSPMYGLEVCRGLDMDPGFLRSAVDLRKRLEEPYSREKVSRYNAGVSVQVCHVCGSKDMLETHHIVPQAEANEQGYIGVGKHKNDVGNLAVLCASCHSKHHAGTMNIIGWVQTSHGRILQVENL